MQVNIIAIGKKMPTWVTNGFEEYTKRMPSECQVLLYEISAAQKRTESDLLRVIRQEGKQMLSAIPKHNYVIALEVSGQLLDTHQLANLFRKWRDDNQDISLLIGGPDGLATECLAKAHMKWSLSPLTFPHPLVRVMLAEQVYRAWSIITHHPYHRS